MKEANISCLFGSLQSHMIKEILYPIILRYLIFLKQIFGRWALWTQSNIGTHKVWQTHIHSQRENHLLTDTHRLTNTNTDTHTPTHKQTHKHIYICRRYAGGQVLMLSSSLVKIIQSSDHCPAEEVVVVLSYKVLWTYKDVWTYKDLVCMCPWTYKTYAIAEWWWWVIYLWNVNSTVLDRGKRTEI